MSTYSVGYRTTHRRYHSDGTTTAMLDHLLRDSLSSHKHAGDLLSAISTYTIEISSRHSSYIHLEHRVRILRRILQRWRLLLNTSRGNQPIKLSLRLANTAHNLIQLRNIAHIDLPVVQCCPYSVVSQHTTIPTRHTDQAPQQPSSVPYRNPDSVQPTYPEHTQ